MPDNIMDVAKISEEVLTDYTGIYTDCDGEEFTVYWSEIRNGLGSTVEMTQVYSGDGKVVANKYLLELVRMAINEVEH